MDKVLDALVPEARTVDFRTERLALRPLTVGQLPALVRVAQPVVDAVLALEAAPGEQALVELALGLIANHGEAVIAAVAIAIRKDAAWVGDADTAEFLTLAIALFEVNRDFFVQTLGPRLQALRAGGASGALTGAGTTSSSSLPSAGTH